MYLNNKKGSEVTIVSVDSSSTGASKGRFLDLNVLRNAQISGGSLPKDKSTEDSNEADNKPSFQNVLNTLINDHLAVQKETEISKSEELLSQKNQKPQIGPNDGFNRGGSRMSDWGPGRNA